MTKLLISSAPVFTIDGQVKGELARDITHLEVSEDTAGLKTLSASLVAQGPQSLEQHEKLLYLDGAIVDFGKSVEVSIGAAADARTIFKGSISGLEISHQEGREPRVVFFAEDKLMDMRMTRRMKTYEQMSDGDIARAIAQEHGLTPEVDADGPTYDVVQQWNQSDLAFLRARAKLIQAEIWLAGSSLYFQTRDKRPGTSITLVRGNELIAIRARADLAHQRTKVVVSGYDASARDQITEEAESSAVMAEVTSGRTGVDILQQAFGERVSYRVRENPIESSHASAWARAEMLRRARAFVTVTGMSRGTPDMVVGSKLELQLMGAPFEGGGYYVTRVTHTYDLANGHRTTFDAERPTVQEGA